jgi:hypothetical protein
MDVEKNVVCDINVEIIAISEMCNVSVGSFFFMCRSYHSVTDCYT